MELLFNLFFLFNTSIGILPLPNFIYYIDNNPEIIFQINDFQAFAGGNVRLDLQTGKTFFSQDEPIKIQYRFNAGFRFNDIEIGYIYMSSKLSNSPRLWDQEIYIKFFGKAKLL